jgi:hypothetical protein
VSEKEMVRGIFRHKRERENKEENGENYKN